MAGRVGHVWGSRIKLASGDILGAGIFGCEKKKTKKRGGVLGERTNFWGAQLLY